MFEVQIRDKETKARTGLLKTFHGDIPTPVFMPVGTGGTVRGILQRDLSDVIDARIILGNTYHLYLRPGTEILRLLFIRLFTGLSVSRDSVSSAPSELKQLMWYPQPRVVDPNLYHDFL